MPAIPLPFITFIVILMLIIKLIFRQDTRYRTAVYFLFACALLMLVSGLRWSYALPFHVMQPLLALLLPPFAWHCFAELTDRSGKRNKLLTAIAAMTMLCLLWPAAIDVALCIFYAVYGCALIRLARSGPDVFSLARLNEAKAARLMAFCSGCLLCFSASVDLIVALDFSFFSGHNAATIVATAQCLLLLPLCLAVAFTSKAPAPVLSLPESTDDTVQLNLVCEKLERLMQEKEFFLDADLTLNKLARKSGIPARQISRAVNQTRSRNVSQWVNGFRVARAQDLLSDSNLPVTQVMLEAGFITKSNFNREFLRLTGLSPSDYRCREAPANATKSR